MRPMRCFTSIAIGFAVALFVSSARADHFSGATVSYECLGSNQYRVNLDLYLDCGGVPITPHTLNFNNNCGVSFSLPNLSPVSMTEVSPLCPSQIANSTCNGGTQPSFRKYRFQVTLTLSPCNKWTISWYTCCRNTTQNVQNEPGMYAEATLNNAGGLCDRSPVFNDVGIPYVCVNQPVNYNLGAFDPDGHAMTFSLIAARFATPAPTAVTYQGGYTAAQPIPGININPITGQLSFFPTVAGYYVVVVEARTFTSGGVLIGTVMRDLLFAVFACDGAPPQTNGISNGTNGLSYSTSQFVACAGNSFCLTLVFTDSNAAQSITIASNAAAVLPGSSLTLSGTNPVTANLCWTATNATYPLGVTFQASDNACPVANASSFAIVALDCAYLPVELLSFKAEPQPDGVAIDWRTASALGTCAYVLERGTEPSRFDSIGSVLIDSGSAVADSDFSFLDRSPILGLGYYRLRIVDWGGSEQTGPVVPVWSYGTGNVSAVASPSGWSVSGAVPGGTWSMLSLTGALQEQGRADENGAFSFDAEGYEPSLLVIESGTERMRLKLPAWAALEQGSRITAKH